MLSSIYDLENDSIYIKDNATAEPKQMELWMSQDGRTRLRVDQQVIFGINGTVTKTFDIEKRIKTEPDEMASFFLRKIGEAEEFSLDSVIKVMFRGQMQEVTPLINPNAVISQDVVVFDVNIPHTPEWVRIWALRESRLPMRIKVWDPRDGASTDAVFEYSKDQSKEFFDPNAFETLLQDNRVSGRTNIVYAFLKDPGGKNITPEEMFKKSVYHMPTVKEVGITKNGAFWVTAGNSRNRMPNGNVFEGFSRIEDDLGRTYFSVGGGHRLRDDTSLDIFVPVDYPFDDRIPSKITLFCETENYDPRTEPEVIGTIDLTEWQNDTPCPNLFDSGNTDPLRLKISLAYKLFGKENAEKLERLVQTIPAWTEQPDNKSLLYFWIRLNYKQDNDQEVIKIGQTLLPLILKNPRSESRYSIREYLIALARTGEIDEAAKLFAKIDAIEEISPEKSNKRYYSRFLQNMADFLTSEAELDPNQISKILGFDISKREDFKSVLNRAKQTANNRKLRIQAEKRLQEISDYYQTHPLPENMELLERPDGQAVYLVGVSNTIPNHEQYKVQPINYAVSNMVSVLRYFNGIHPYDIVPVRIEDDAAEQKLSADLIYKDGATHKERAQFVLSLSGMELVTEDGPSRKVLVAKYDGRKLKDPQQIKTPFGYDSLNKLKPGTTASSAHPGFGMDHLLDDLARQQNRNIEDDGKKLVIIDETGLEGPVSGVTAFWTGDKGFELAKKWFKDNFGVTFSEETRTLKTYVIRKKQ